MPKGEGVAYRALDMIGAPGYRVGSDGSVWSRRIPRSRTRGGVAAFSEAWRPLKTSPNKKNGYLYVSLYTESGKQMVKTVHSLVALAFLGEPPPGQEVRHKDGKRANCRLDNLVYGTRSQNMQDARGHGTIMGTRRSNARINDVVAGRIKGMIAAGLRTAEITRKTGAPKHIIQNIRTRGSWPHAEVIAYA